MCGFTCVLLRNRIHNASRSVIPADILGHRGPDFTNEVIYDHVAIRHWRLSIVDLTSESNQPICNDDEIFVYNGELYDYADLGKKFGIIESGDTKTFQKLLNIEGGKEVLRTSSGFYSYLSYKKNTRILTGGRDTFGKKPLYYYIDSSVAVFSSEERGILPFVKSVQVNNEALGDYFLFKDRFFGQSLFSGIKEFAPGCDFEFDTNAWALSESLNWEEYYGKSLLGILNIEPQHINLESSSCAEQFELAVSKRVVCDVPIQIALSGGGDSIALASVAMNSINSGNVLQALTVKFSEGEDESTSAQFVANALKIKHEIINFDSSSIVDQVRHAVRAFCCPVEHPHSLAYLQMCNFAGRFGKVLLTGEGADEFFFGYRHYEKYQNDSFAFREYLHAADEDLFYKKIGHHRPFDPLRSESLLKLRGIALESPAHSRNLEIKTHLLSLLRRNDRMSMANSVEIRAPFLDPDLVALALFAESEASLKNRKQFIFDIVRKYIPTHPSFGRKNGFRIPFDENYNAIQLSSDGKSHINLGKDVVQSELGLVLKDDRPIGPRLGWSLLNIGIFYDEFFLRRPIYL